MRSAVYPLSNARSDNRLIIFKHVRKAPISRSDISKSAGICKSSVTALTNQMISQGLLTEIGSVDTGVGRRPVLLDIVADYGYAVGVSVGRDNFVCISDLKANAIVCSDLDYGDEPSKAPQKIKETIEEILSLSNIPLKKCIGIGISISECLRELGENIKQELERAFGLPVRVDTPTELLCTANASSCDGSSILISLGDELLSAVCIDGKILKGGNIEHFSIDCNGDACACGSRGCLGGYVSDEALRKNGYSTSPDNADTAEYIAEKLYCALISVCNLLALKRIIVCGTSKKNGEKLINALRERLQSKAGIELAWVELSFETARNSVCSAIINEYFERQ